jgi:hypothetical protein
VLAWRLIFGLFYFYATWIVIAWHNIRKSPADVLWMNAPRIFENRTGKILKQAFYDIDSKTEQLIVDASSWT